MSYANREITVILDNIRSAHNVGAILRSCDVFNIKKVICCGITPHLPQANDERLPHVQRNTLLQISKTALGSEKTTKTLYVKSITQVISNLHAASLPIFALEQAKNSVPIEHFTPPPAFAVVFGSEINGVNKQVLKECNEILEISQYGSKESLNVSVAAGIALFQLSH